MKGKLFILSGQSGVGKKTILFELLKRHPEFHHVVTHTTREPRPNEIPGEDHFFVYREKFEEMIKNDEFIEYTDVHGNLFGTPKEQIDKALEEGKNVLMEMDVKGMTNIKDKYQPITVFLKYEPGNIEDLIRNRIKNDPARKNTSEEEIQTRIATAKKEAEYEKNYDYSVVNPEGHPEQAIGEVEKIIQQHAIGKANELKKN